MKKEVTIVKVLAVIVFVLTLLLLVSAINVQVTYQETPGEKCERMGGIYFMGGAFSASNCVFPPK